MAERTTLMANFQRGKVTLPEYKLLLSSLYAVYLALEEELDRNASHPCVAPIHFPTELSRVAALEADLRYFHGQNWRDQLTTPPATQSYAERLHEVGQHHPELLVAHAYTRYLGDLSGGQVLGRIAQKALGLGPGGEGLAFFAFPGVTNATKFKQLYRARMNSLELSPGDKSRVTEEADRAFNLNIQVFQELQVLLGEPETGSETPRDLRHRAARPIATQGDQSETKKLHAPPFKDYLSSFPLLRLVLGICFAMTTVAIGMYAL
ncbi:heme oxygenase 1a isoform X2 [Lepisosteus oculatus]